MALVRGWIFDDVLSGTSFADEMHGDWGNDVLVGKEGNDRLFGEDGNDHLHGGSGEDQLDGGQGDDTLFGGEHRDTLKGGAGKDVLFGESGNDRVEGGEGNDTLRGGSEDDVLLGGNGSDTLFGDDGNDTFIDVVGADTFNGGSGIDTVDYSSYSGRVNVTLANGGDTGFAVQFPSYAMNTSDGLSDSIVSVENVVGTAYGDTIRGNSSVNVITGKGGVDTLFGGAGNDTFVYLSKTDAPLDQNRFDGRQVDSIMDFARGDIIDLRGIDANDILPGNQAFAFVNDFTGTAGQLQADYFANGSDPFWSISGDTNGDRIADFAIDAHLEIGAVANYPAMATDFLL